MTNVAGSGPNIPALDQPFRDRIIDFRRVRAAELSGAPWNWRSHPDAQRDAVVGSLEELGITEPLKTRLLPDGSLQLWDGHLRQEILNAIGPDTIIPVVVTDLNEEEAKKANLIHDPLAALAEADQPKLDALLAEIQTDSPAIVKMLEDLAKVSGCEWGQSEAVEPEAPTLAEQFNILIECESEDTQAELLERFAGEGLKCRSLIS